MSTQALPFIKPYHNGTFNRMMMNATRILAGQLLGKPCLTASQDLKLYCAKPDIMTYPDVMVFCDRPRFYDSRRDVITDANFIVEVLSPSTSKYDRTDKFDYYQPLESSTEYLMIFQDRVLAELHTRQPEGSWLSRKFAEPDAEITLSSIGCRLHLGSLYDRVEFET